MDLLGLTLALTAVLAMVLQCGASVLKKNRLTVGVLNFILATAALFFIYFLRSGTLVLAPEFGAVMVQGESATWFLRLALVAIAIVPTLFLHRVTPLYPLHLWPRILTGLVIGSFAATRLQLLNPEDAISLHVHLFDVWWPVLIVWIAFCLADTLGNLAWPASRVAHVALATAIVPLAARFALVHQELSDPQSRPLWTLIEPVALLIFVLTINDAYLLRRIGRGRVLIFRLLAFASLAALALYGFHKAGYWVRLIVDLLPLLVYFGRIPFKTAYVLLRPPADPPPPPLRQRFHLLRDRIGELRAERLAGVLFTTSALAFPLCLIDIFSINALPRDLDIGILAAFWLGFSARLAEGIFTSMPKLVKQGELQLPRLATAWRGFRFFFAATRKSVGGAFTSFTSGGAWTVTFRSIAVTVLGLLGLVAVGEALNYRQQVVEPFVWRGTGDDTDKVAARVSDGIVNTLGNMRRELAPVLIVSQAAGPNSGPNSKSMVQPAILDSDAIESAAAKSDDLKVGSVAIPIPFLVQPIQHIVRWAFNIHTVTGSLHKSFGDTRYVALIYSDRGETWKVVRDIPAKAEPVKEPEKPAAAPATPTAPAAKPAQTAAAPKAAAAKQAAAAQPKDSLLAASPSAASKPAISTPAAATAAAQASSVDDTPDTVPSRKSLTCGKEGVDSDQLDDLIEEAAFHIASADPSFIAMGLTGNWKSYEDFRSGLHAWNCYQAYKHASDLESSIDSFHQAIQEDSHFAPAYYRLGIALQSANAPESAIHAFKNSIAANPQLLQAQTAEAQTLATYANFLPSSPAILDVTGLYVDSTKNAARSREARDLWAAVLAQPATPENELDQRTSLVGLCANSFNIVDASNSAKATDHFPNKFYLNYFFCTRADTLLSSSASQGPNDSERNRMRAYVLSILGDSLNDHDLKTVAFPVAFNSELNEYTPWTCSWTNLDFGPFDLNSSFVLDHRRWRGSDLTAHALRYYDRSLALVPDDDDVLCRRASAEAYLLGHEGPALKALEQSPTAHKTLASDLFQVAGQYDHDEVTSRAPRQAELIYKISLIELQRTLDLAPASTDTLMSYAYVVWQRAINAHFHHDFVAPEDIYQWVADANTGANYASQAVRLGHNGRDPHDETDAIQTLAEVLMAQGRYTEALQMLSDSTDAINDSSNVDEFTWDLAQAQVCSAFQANSPAVSQQHLDKGAHELAWIKEHENTHEVQIFSQAPEVLSLTETERRCFAPPSLRLAFYQLVPSGPPTYIPQPGCSTLTTVEAQLDGDYNPSMQVAVIGPGAAQFINFSQMTQFAQIGPPKRGSSLYFALARGNFKNGNGEDVTSYSDYSSFEIPQEPDPGCLHGHIVLHFKIVPPPAPLPAVTPSPSLTQPVQWKKTEARVEATATSSRRNV